jgi:hypothetical protein
MIDKGNFDEAIDYAIGKLAGKKNKDLKYVVALEEAFAKATAKDVDQINYLSKKGNNKDLDFIYKSYLTIKRRQQKVTPLLPLKAENGYLADFNIVNYDDKIIKAANMASEYHYQKAVQLLNEAKNDKYKAREAYSHLEQIEKYQAEYKDSQELVRKAIELGTVNIAIEHDNRVNNRDSWYIEESMINWPFYKMDNRWMQFHYYNNENIPIDYYIVVNLNDIDVGHERESVNRYEVVREIEVLKPQKELDKIKLDSTKTEKDKYKKIKVKAIVTEIKREKYAFLESSIRIINNNRSIVERNIPITINEKFEGYSSRYEGDERAIEGNPNVNLDNFCEDFPSDISMLSTIASVFQTAVFKEIEKRKYELEI